MLAMLQVEISGLSATQAPISNLPPPSLRHNPTDRIVTQLFRSSSTDPNPSSKEAETEKTLKLALGLLLKHRGGPGFGHGRLQGKELQLMDTTLRSAASILQNEARVAQI